MKHILSLCMVFAMLLLSFNLTGCKGKQGKEVEVDISSKTSPLQGTDIDNDLNFDTDSKTSSPSKTESNVSDSVSSDTTVIIGEDVVIDMGEELF